MSWLESQPKCEEKRVGQPNIGIIGGTGLGDVLLQQSGSREVTVDTPFGPPSSPIVLTAWEGVEVAFLARHGPGHVLQPSRVPFRANIWALKKLGVSTLLASCAMGSLREEYAPGHLVLCDQVIDKTFRRAGTFFELEPVVHVALADPFCPRLRGLLQTAGTGVDDVVHPRGTCVCMEGPQFSTRAEAHLHRQWGADLIGMTSMPEAKLAREAELCYALIALVTDYDCWRAAPPGGHDELVKEVLSNLKRASDAAVTLFRAALPAIAADTAGCGCPTALDLAVWSDANGAGDDAASANALLLERYRRCRR